MSPLKRFERFGRRLLVACLARVLGARERKVEVRAEARILVVRLDERVGNLVLLTPLLATLRARFPGAVIDVLGYAKTRVLLERHPAVNEVLAFDKRALTSARGPLRIFGFLKRRRYDLAIDAANPTDPSFTQALVTRFSGAAHTIGSAFGDFARLYSAPAAIADDGKTHEIDLRLQLLRPIPGAEIVREPRIALGPPSEEVRRFIDEVGTYTVLNLGARVREKWLSLDEYVTLANALSEQGVPCVLTWGPQEQELAREVAAAATRARMAPATTLADLAAILAGARRVVTCDTGPMHIAVALGAPTCAIFVSTDPARYGYATPPHLAVSRAQPGWDTAVRAWLRGAAS